jgi:hypothetical protein
MPKSSRRASGFRSADGPSEVRSTQRPQSAERAQRAPTKSIAAQL